MPTAHVAANKAHLQTSVWSPDTPDTAASFNYCRAPSSVYSRALTPCPAGHGKAPPPVPALPASVESEDDNGTPCTLFEEDGNSPAQRQARAKVPCMSPDSATSRAHGWWDHVVTPFLDKSLSFSSRKAKADSPRPGATSSRSFVENGGAELPTTRQLLLPTQAPIVRKPAPPLSSLGIKAVQPSQGASPPEAAAEAAPVAAGDEAPSDQPPPYSPAKKQAAAAVRYRAVFPPRHPLHAQFPPSPCPASPGLAATMTSQGATQMTDIPLTPTVHGRAPSRLRIPLPVRPLGSYEPQDHDAPAAGRVHKVERRRRRHEKEEVAARRLGGFWRGRGCVPSAGCFGRSGREGRQRRRVWLLLSAALVLLVVLIIVLAVVLTRRHHEPPRQTPSIWVNLTDFPPMPTGVLTVVGPDNSVSRSACTLPSTLWSCSLPKDQHDSVAPYKANQPAVVLRIQWNNGTRHETSPHKASLGCRRNGIAPSSSRVLGRRQTAPRFTPDPAAPSREEAWFLGNTMDNIQSENKAGESMPFYISLLKSAKEPSEDSVLSRRQSGARIGNESLERLLLAPELEADGTPAPAVMLPTPVEQPVRLFDRGLPTEYYGFYTHFKRSLFLRSVTVPNGTEDGNVPLDEDGGCRKNEASHLVTWGETRVLVQMWTRALDLNASALVRPDESHGIGGTGELMRPGTMPYPVTVTLDTHGGDAAKKLVWSWPVDKRQRVGVDKAELLANNMGVGGTWINTRGSGDRAMGGFDGGSGGCKCEWVNWVKRAS